jgi:hydroxymethylbilane synthase
MLSSLRALLSMQTLNTSVFSLLRLETPTSLEIHAPTTTTMASQSAAGASAAAALIARRRAEKVVVIGSRKSDLALWQARRVQKLLSDAFPEFRFVIETEATTGDHVLDMHLAVLAAASPGLFTKELEVGLLGGLYDIAVHSLKDMPTTLPRGLALAAISEREDPRDALILSARHAGAAVASLADFPPGAVIGTSSVRREALLRRQFPHLTVRSVRGNLATRFRKLDAPLPLASEVEAGAPAAATAADAAGGSAAGNVVAAGAAAAAAASAPSTGASAPAPQQHYDALLLAYAGVKRLGWQARVTALLDPSEWPYGVGQGSLGLEVRSDDPLAAALCRSVAHPASALVCAAERTFMNQLQGGCQVPIGIAAAFERSTTASVGGVGGVGGAGSSGGGTGAGGISGASRPAGTRVVRLHGAGSAASGSVATSTAGRASDGTAGASESGAGVEHAAAEESEWCHAAYPAAGEAATLTLTGTVCALDGSATYTCQVSAVTSIPRRHTAAISPTAAASSAAAARAAAEAPLAGAAAGSGTEPVAVPHPTCGISAADWLRLQEEARELGCRLAAKIVAAGATNVLGPLTAARPITYGSAEAAGLTAGPAATAGAAAAEGAAPAVSTAQAEALPPSTAPLSPGLT